MAFSGVTTLLSLNYFQTKLIQETKERFVHMQLKNFPKSASDSTIYDYLFNPYIYQRLLSLPVIWVLGNLVASSFGLHVAFNLILGGILGTYVENQFINYGEKRSYF